MWSGERKDKIQKNTHTPPRKSPSTTMRKLDLQIQCRGLLIVCSLLYLSSGIGETTWQHSTWEVNPFSSYPSPSLSTDLTVLPSFVSLLCSWASQVSKHFTRSFYEQESVCLQAFKSLQIWCWLETTWAMYLYCPQIDWGNTSLIPFSPQFELWEIVTIQFHSTSTCESLLVVVNFWIHGEWH
jgi:hypothetical protein